jgi:molybdopterin-dependent oxidoreductase alpha subunit
MHEAKKAGTRIVAVNAFREPGMERYWIPSVPESALFGTKLADETVLIHIGGDVAFLNGVLKHMVAEKWVDHDFIAAHTEGFATLAGELDAQDWAALEAQSGVTRETMRAFASQVAAARTAVWVWSMGVTQHAQGENNVRAIVNLALAGGFVGREHCGVVPIRGHSGVQGGAEMGAYATAFPGGLPITPENARHLSEKWGFAVPDRPGLTSPRMMAAALDGRLDVLHAAGGNFMDVMPEPELVRKALSGVPLRVHQDIVVTSQMLVPAKEAVILLPAATRYETPGGVTQTSTERRITFSPEIPGRRVGEARPEWSIYMDLARRVRPDRATHLAFPNTHSIRAEIARVVPAYAGIETLRAAGDQVQSGGRLLCVGGAFPTPDGHAHFVPVPLKTGDLGPGQFRLSTRRGKQFNSIVHARTDALTGAARDAVLMSAADANELQLEDGASVTLASPVGTMRAHVCVAPIKPGNLEVHWPEGNVLIDHRGLSEEVDIPDYNATVTVQAAS